jgi:hypothetical protein
MSWNMKCSCYHAAYMNVSKSDCMVPYIVQLIVET